MSGKNLKGLYRFSESCLPGVLKGVLNSLKLLRVFLVAYMSLFHIRPYGYVTGKSLHPHFYYVVLEGKRGKFLWLLSSMGFELLFGSWNLSLALTSLSLSSRFWPNSLWHWMSQGYLPLSPFLDVSRGVRLGISSQVYYLVNEGEPQGCFGSNFVRNKTDNYCICDVLYLITLC